MEKILSSSGLQHIAENIFFNLDVEHLQICGILNGYSKQILDSRMFQDAMYWVRKYEGLSLENQNDWVNHLNVIQGQHLYTYKRKYAIISYLRWNLKNGAMMDLPCYTSPLVQSNFRKRIREICEKREISGEELETVKIMAHLTVNPNAEYDYDYKYYEDKSTPILLAAWNGHIEVVKILAPLTRNPNLSNRYGETPIFKAAYHGHTRIVKILAPLTDNPNAPDNYGDTPIYRAACCGHTEIVKILAPLTDNPNRANARGETPIQVAKSAEICRILEPTLF